MKRLLALLLLVAAPAFGGVTFDATSNAKLSSTSVESTAAPLTICLMINPANTTTNYFIASVGDTAGDNEWFGLAARGADTGDPIRAFTASGGPSAGAITSTGFSASTWQSACGVYTAANSRAAFLAGGSKGTETTSLTPSGIDATGIGFLNRATPAGFFNGDIAEVGIWNRALGDGEVAGLGLGYSPTCYANTVGYYRMLTKTTTERDEFGSTRINLTYGSGTSTASTHPRITNCQ